MSGSGDIVMDLLAGCAGGASSARRGGCAAAVRDQRGVTSLEPEAKRAAVLAARGRPLGRR